MGVCVWGGGVRVRVYVSGFANETKLKRKTDKKEKLNERRKSRNGTRQQQK